MSTIIIKAHDQVNTIAEHQVVTESGQPKIITATDKINYELIDEATGAAPKHIVTKRSNNDLQITFDDQSDHPELIIEGFYEVDGALVGISEDGNYYYYVPDSGEVGDFVTELESGEAQGQALGGSPQSSPWWVGAAEGADGDEALPWLVGLAGVGVLAAALGSSSSHSSSFDEGIDGAIPKPPTDVTVGNGDEFINGDEIDADGNVDVVVGLPDDVAVGDTVIVNGSEQTVTEDDITNGNVVVKVPAPSEGDSLEVTVTIKNPAGNSSDEVKVDAGVVDTTAPDAPTDVTVGNGDGVITEDDIDANGNIDVVIKLPDNAAVGDTVIVNGKEQTVTEDDITNGNVVVKVPAPSEGDSLEVSVTIKDPAGNTSDDVTVDAGVVDTSPNPPEVPDVPSAPTIDQPIAGDNMVNNEEAQAGFQISGKGDAGNAITVINQEGVVIGNTTVDGNGNWSIQVDANGVAALGEGEQTLTATATNDSGKTAVSKATITIDTMIPSAPTDVTVGNGDDFITNDEIDSNGNVDVAVGLPDNVAVGDTVIVNGSEQEITENDITNGNVVVKVPAPSEGNSLEVSVTIKDAAGNMSDEVTVGSGVVDTTAPDAPTDIMIGNGDETITADEIVDGEVAVQIGLPENAQENDIVVVNGIEQTLTDTDITNGNVVVQIPVPSEGEALDVTASLKDLAGNESEATTATATRDTADSPMAPESVIVGNGDDFITADEIDEDGNVTVNVALPSDATLGSVVVVNGIEQAVTDENLASGNVNVKIPAPGEGEQLTASASIRNPAGNASTVVTAKAVQDTIAPDAPTGITVGNDDGFINAEEIDADGNVDVVVGLPDNVAVGDTVIVNDKAQTITADDITNSNVVVKVPVASEGESLDVVASIQDPAGNVSPDLTVNAGVVDTIAPNQPTEVTVGNGDGFITADDIDADGNVDVVVGLPDNVAVGDTVIVNDKAQTITADDITNGNVVVKVPVPSEGESLDVVASIQDPAGNTSPNLTVNSGVVDTIAPNAPSIIVSPDGTAITGTAEAGAVINVDINGDGTPDFTVIADNNGNYVVDTSGSPVVEGQTISATATDTAGNTSAPNQITVGAPEIVAAADDNVALTIDAIPTETDNGTQSRTDFTVASVGLGPVLNTGVLDQIADSAIQFNVGSDEIRQVTVHGDSGGIQVGGTANLYVYKLNESTNQWEQQEVKENWVVAPLLGGRSEDSEFDLTEGQWLFFMAPASGVSALTGYSLYVDKDVTLDYGNAESISGQVSGNVLTNDDAQSGQDEIPSGTTLTSVNGVEIVAGQETTIEGQFGTLTIQADGTYNYVVNSDFRGPFGSEDTFTYTITSPNGKTSFADLNIQLNLQEVNPKIDSDATLVVDLEPKVILDTDNSDIDAGVNFSLVSTDLLGPVLGAEVLGGIGAMEFNVGDNQVRELTFHGSAGGISLGKTFDLYVYKLDPDTGNYVQVHKEDNWFNVVLLGGRSDPLTMSFGEGDYKVFLQGQGLLGVAEGAGVYVDHDTIYDYNQPTKFVGQIEGDATPVDSTTLLQVEGQTVTSGQETVIQGEFGKLIINSDGSYVYNVEKPADAGADWTPPYGQVESFQIITQDASGMEFVDKLNIKISTHEAIDDINDVSVDASNVVSDITFSRDYKAVGNYGNEMTETFEITDNQEASATIEVQSSAEQVTYTLTNTTTGEVFTKTVTGDQGQSLSDSIDSLPAGEYTINITTSGGILGGNIKGYKFVTNVVTTNEFEATNIDTVTGLLLGNDLGAKNITELKIGNSKVFVADENQGADTIDIKGAYGTLTVAKDGSYTYTPSGEDFGIEQFVYETTSVTGQKETATLEINVGKTITASIYDDVVTSSAANDSFTMGAGADTVIFENLGGTLGGNGNNGLDSWTDFDAAQGDRIDVSTLLDGNQTADNLSNYLAYDNGILMVDRSGNGNFEGLLKVDAASFDELLASIDWQPADTPAGLAITAASDTVFVDIDDSTGFDYSVDSFQLADVLETDELDISETSIAALAESASLADSDVSGSIYVNDDSAPFVNDPIASLNASNDGAVYDVWQAEIMSASQSYLDTDMSNII